MRQIVIVATAVVALLGASAMIADVPQKIEAAATSSEIDIMQMTRDAKDLPIERFDAI
jgi:hypothetical protein